MSVATNGAAMLREPAISVRLVLETVAATHDLTVKGMLQHRRHAHLVRPRQIAMHLAYVHSQLSLPAIAALIGRDHTTVWHGHNRIALERRENPATEAEVAAIEATVLIGARTLAGLNSCLPDIDAVALARRVTDTLNGDTMVSLNEIRAMALFILACECPETHKETSDVQ